MIYGGSPPSLRIRCIQRLMPFLGPLMCILAGIPGISAYKISLLQVNIFCLEYQRILERQLLKLDCRFVIRSLLARAFRQGRYGTGR